MGWFKAAKNTMNALARQVKLDFCDLRILATERIKHEDAFYCPDHTRAFEKQKLEHIYKMLMAERAAVLASMHEPHEISESIELYDDWMKKKAKLIASSGWPYDIEKALKSNQEKDPAIDTKERVLASLYATNDFISRIFLYCIVGLAFGLIGLKICCG